MAINSCQKGKRGERLWRDELKGQGYNARRGQQFSGSPDSPDVICPSLSHLHFEVKTVEKLNIGKAFEQATRDAGAAKTPVLVHKRNRGPWLVTVWSHDWFKFLRGELCPEATPLTAALPDCEPNNSQQTVQNSEPTPIAK